MVSLSEQLVVIRDVVCGEGLGEMLDGRVAAGRFGSLVGEWLFPLCGELFCGGVWGFFGLGGMCGSSIGCGAVGRRLVMPCALLVASLCR